MIVDSDGEKYTPKQIAQKILLDQAARAGYWREGDMVEVDFLTDREAALIEEQLEKQFERIQKLFNYTGWQLG